MENVVFVAVLAAFFSVVFRWAFRALPNEQWQFIASVPVRKEASDSWSGRNYTFYGLFQAVAAVSGVSLTLVLIGSVGAPAGLTVTIIAVMVLVCVPASKIVAMIVEKKKGTFTVGGAVFVGMLTTPVVVWGVNHTLGTYVGFTVPYLPVFAAIATGYALGEGVGRLACLSFGCCYGRALSECSPLTRRLLEPYRLVYTGKTKKISYESGLEGKDVVPIQAMTSIVYALTCLISALLFLNSYFKAALVLSFVVTQAWRFWSETLRADYRGEGKVSTYQIMAAVGVILVIAISFFLHDKNIPAPGVIAGLGTLWSPAVILFLQGIGLAVFLYLGRSTVTTSTISFDVAHDRI